MDINQKYSELFEAALAEFSKPWSPASIINGLRRGCEGDTICHVTDADCQWESGMAIKLRINVSC